MHKETKPQRGGTTLRILLSLSALFLIPVLLLAAAPQWWTDRGLLNGNEAHDFAIANQGQVKNFAIAAYNEMVAKLPEGSQAQALINALSKNTLIIPIITALSS